MKNDLSSAHHRASVRLFQTAGWLQAEFDNCLRPFGLSAQRLRVLSFLAGEAGGTATVGTVRDGMMDPNSNISRLLNKLMEKGLIDKLRQRHDQRVVSIEITPSGRDICAKAQRTLAAQDAVWSRLAPDEAETLANLLDRLRG